MVKTRFLVTSLALLTIAFPQSACTLAGYGIGTLVDSGNSRTWAPEAFVTDTVDVGETIDLAMRDGEELSGAFYGIEQMPEKDYAQRYEAARERHPPDFPLPVLGDTVSLCLTPGSQLDVEFLGFDVQEVLVRRHDDSTTEGVRPTEIEALVMEGGAIIQGQVLTLWLADGTVPFRSAIALQVRPAIQRAGGRRAVPLDQVQRVELKSHSGRRTGTLVGVIIDGVVVAAALAFAVGMSFYEF
jgi:hypothetical protein